MATKRKKRDTNRIVKTSGSYIEGKVDAGGDFIGRDQINVSLYQAKITKTFQKIESEVDNSALPNPEKEDLKESVSEIKEELAKGNDASESFISQRLRNIGRIAPDILQVIMATMADPIAGLGTVAAKIAEKAKNNRLEGKGQ